MVQLTLSPTGYCNPWVPRGGADSAPPYQTLLLGLFCLVSFYESIYIYYRTYHAKGQVSSFKIVDLAAVWNSDPAARKLSANILNVRISVDFEYFEVWFFVNIFIYVLEQDSKKKKWGKLKLFPNEFFLGEAALFEGAGRGDPHFFSTKKFIQKFLNWHIFKVKYYRAMFIRQN